METFYSAYLEQLQEMHAEIEHALEGLPPEAFDWVPGPDMNTLAVLIAHTAGAERYWIGDVAAQVPSDRDRDSEFRVRGLDAATLRASLARSLDFARERLAAFAVSDLAQERVARTHTQSFTVGWALVHALQHTANHAGHIQILRQLWDQHRNSAMPADPAQTG
jgi:uncharacterized damage-inducible protein DinB